MKIISSLCLFSIAFLSPLLNADVDMNAHEIRLEVNLLCPTSAELQNLIDAIPKNDTQATNFEEWSRDFVQNMQKLIELVQSGKVGNASFSIDVDDNEPTPSTP